MFGGWGSAAGPAENEAGTLSWATFDADAAAVFAKNLAADGESDTGSAGTFGGFEDVENGGPLIFRNSGAIITDGDEHHICGAVETSLDNNCTPFDTFDGIDGIGDDIEDSAMNAFGIEEGRRDVVTWSKIHRHAGFSSPCGGKFGDFLNDMIEFSILRAGTRSLLKLSISMTRS